MMLLTPRVLLDANPYNGAPPAGVPKEFDCAWRRAAYAYGKKLQPSMTAAHQQQLSDSLQLGACPGGAPAPDSRVTEERRRTFAIPKGSTPIYVQPATDGLHAALGHARRVGGPVTLSLMPGVHRLTKPLLLSPADSNTTIQSFGGGETVLTGSRSIFAGLSCEKYKVSGDPATVKWSEPAVGQNAIYAGCCSGTSAPCTGDCAIRLFGTTASAANKTCNVWTWHAKDLGPPYALRCYFRSDGVYMLTAEVGHVSGHKISNVSNTWKASIPPARAC